MNIPVQYAQVMSPICRPWEKLNVFYGIFQKAFLSKCLVGSQKRPSFRGPSWLTLFYYFIFKC